jgi:superfamily II DNA/RNA helicase
MAEHRPDSDPAGRASRDKHATPVLGFADLGVPPNLVAALARQDVVTPFPIQTATLRDAIAGRDVLGRGRTGSGKTLAFALPLITRLAAGGRSERTREPRALVLAPTRELARQIQQVIDPLASAVGLRSTAVFGGVGIGPQLNAFRRGVDIVVACPGRLEDLLRSRATSLRRVEVTVIDEADHMADLGFLPSVRRLLDLTPADGQRLLFSATLDGAVDVLVHRYLSEPVTHSVDDERSPVAEMTHHVLQLSSSQRLEVVVDLTSAPGRKLVFTRTKHRARQLARQLVAAGVPAVEMHGDLSQSVRTRNLDAFKSGRATALVATDIAARGLHIDDIELVIHADPPIEHKAYLHRSGRTARAGASGTVVTLATEEQRADVARLGRHAGIKPVVTQHHRDHPILRQLAPGERTLVRQPVARETPARQRSAARPVDARHTERRGRGDGRGSGRNAAGGAVRARRGGGNRGGR